MNLFESERKVMDVLWREGSITAGEIAKILNIDIGWNRNTTYTVINKCIKKGYISRGPIVPPLIYTPLPPNKGIGLSVTTEFTIIPLARSLN